MRQNLPVVARMLAMGANPNQITQGYRPMHWAMILGGPDYAKLFAEAGTLANE
jgi:ankyrin repeat protein